MYSKDEITNLEISASSVALRILKAYDPLGSVAAFVANGVTTINAQARTVETAACLESFIAAYVVDLNAAHHIARLNRLCLD
jgi:hypothetical protein